MQWTTWQKGLSKEQMCRKAVRLNIFHTLAACSLPQMCLKHFWGSSHCSLTAIGHGPQRKSEGFQATARKESPGCTNDKVRKHAEWKRYLARDKFTQRSQQGASVPKSLLFLLAPLCCKGALNSCWGVLFANWRQVATILKGNLKTFKLAQVREHKDLFFITVWLPATRGVSSTKCLQSKRHLATGNFSQKSQLGCWEGWKSSTFLMAPLCYKGAPNFVRGVLIANDCIWQWAMTRKGNLKAFKLGA